MNDKIKEKRLKVTSLPQNGDYVPGIRLQGKYFQNLGFNYGDVVLIRPKGDGTLEITKAKPEQ